VGLFIPSLFQPQALKTFGRVFFYVEILGSFSRYKFNEQTTLFQEHQMATALATHSNEAKIQRGLEHLGCAARNFVLIAKTVGLTRFMEGLNGVPGRHFCDQDAQRMLESLGELYELQIDVDAVNGSHIPIDFSKVDAVGTALTIRRVAKIAAEENDHALDAQALRATTALTERK
jgi:hypothetical protein